MTKFFETQSQLLAAQVQAVSLPPLVCFDGHTEGDDTDFTHWLERFKESSISQVDRGDKVVPTKTAPRQTG